MQTLTEPKTKQKNEKISQKKKKKKKKNENSMASFLKLQRTASKEIAEAYHKAALVAEERRAAETHAATLIQAAFRVIKLK
jgi:hypothetical protein